MLLHVNKLNGDMIDKVLAMFARKQYRFVRLDRALADPALFNSGPVCHQRGLDVGIPLGQGTRYSREWFGGNRAPGFDRALRNAVTGADHPLIISPPKSPN